MASFFAVRTRIRTGVVALGILALLAAGGPAQAATAVSLNPDRTWGTKVVDGKAQKVLALLQAGSRVYLGGEFTTMVSPQGSTAGRNRLAAVDVATGALTSWNPKADGRVRALALSADGQRLYVAGDFSHIGGVSARKVAAVNLSTGRVDTRFKPRVSGRVRALAVSGDRLYIGGDFSSVAGRSRSRIAAVDAATGALLDWAAPQISSGAYRGQTGVPTPDAVGAVTSLAVSGDGSKVYAGGTFLNFAGQGGLLALDGSTGQPLATQWKVGRPLFALTMSPDGSTFFAAAGGAGGRGYAFRPSKTSGPLWQVKVDGDAVGVAASARTMYLMGHYDYIVASSSSCYQYCPNGNRRRHIAAFDAETGALDPWNPTANTSTGPYPAAIGQRHLLIGGAFTKINGRTQPGYAQFPGAP